MPAFADQRAAYFALSDALRRAQANALDALGLGPREHDYKVIDTGPCWRLRDYSRGKEAPSLLIVASPIKRPYIWDLAPQASAIGHCLDSGLNVYLLEWTGSPRGQAQAGLDDYVAGAIGACVAKITEAAHGVLPFLIGHSLGGTLAAIFCTYEPRASRGLVLLGAPLSFETASSGFRDALVSLAPASMSEFDVVAGSLLAQASAAASPKTFFWARWKDAALSLHDPRALAIHARIERWSLDEVALSAKLVDQVVSKLYRENSFCRGSLTIRGRTVGPASLEIPLLAVINRDDEVASMPAVAPFVDKAATADRQIIAYPGETGVVLQHLGMLVGRDAFANLWPQIVAWLKERS
jgi:polyhydroxyalkanoate synthase